MSAPVLAFGSDSPADLLENAASVLRFLAELAPAMGGDGGGAPLDERTANGLCLVLLTVEATVQAAAARL